MNHRAEELILHFGLPKTGTSALQSFLFSQRKILMKKHNVLYPGEQENHCYLEALFSENPESLFQIQMLGFESIDDISNFLRKFRESLLREINTTKPKRIIISSEYFVGTKLVELKKLCSFLETITEKIVLFAYVRDPWSWSISLLQEQILGGYRERSAKVIYNFPLQRLIKRFEDAFDIRPVIAPYINQPSSFNVVDDFCQRFKIDDLANTTHTDRKVRKGMNLEAACVMLKLNQLYPVFDENKTLIEDRARDLIRQTIRNSPLSTTPLRISTMTANEIYQNSKDDMEFLEKEYFGGNQYFTDYYKAFKTIEFDDTLSVSNLDPEKLSEFLLSCMRVLAEHTVNDDEWKVLQFLRRIRTTLAPPNSFRIRILKQLMNKFLH